MKTSVNGRKFEITAPLRERTEKKLARLQKYFDDETDARVTYSTERGRYTAEVTLYSRGLIFRAQEVSGDIVAALDGSLASIERQIRKNKTRLSKRLRENAFDKPEGIYAANEATAEEDVFNVVREKSFSLRLMTVDEAILQMNLLGHKFFVFMNATNSRVNVVYVRNDGGYGLIDPLY